MQRLALAMLALGLLASPASASRYTLDALLAKVRSDYAGVQAAEAEEAAASAQRSQANRLLLPTGELNFGITGSPEVHCVGGVNDCITTNIVDLKTGNGDFTDALPIHGVALRVDAHVLQPLYTFGKIDAARAAAAAGEDAASAKVAKARAEVSLQALRAYWGLKWARASVATLTDGRDKLKGWVDKVNDALDRGGKTAFTETDLLRLKLAASAADLALLDVDKARKIALSAIRTLTSDPNADIDDAELDPVELGEHPLSYYQDVARTHRPEARMLDDARDAALAGQSLRRSQLFPDFALVGDFLYSYAQSVDNPNNAFMNHPNALGAGLYLVMRTHLDYGQKLAKLKQAEAEARVVDAERREALGGIALELDRAYANANEARKREAITEHAQRVARGWLNAVDENMQLGTAEARDMVDAARSYFEMRLKYLQSIMDLNIAVATLNKAAGLQEQE